MISKASSRACSHSVVSIEMWPPNTVCSLARVVPTIERERTVTPRTTPSAWTMWCPSRVKVVLVISGPIAILEVNVGGNSLKNRGAAAIFGQGKQTPIHVLTDVVGG